MCLATMPVEGSCTLARGVGPMCADQGAFTLMCTQPSVPGPGGVFSCDAGLRRPSQVSLMIPPQVHYHFTRDVLKAILS